MTSEARGAIEGQRPERSTKLPVYLPLLAGLLVLGVPTFGNLGRQVWTTDLGAHGPIVLATGLWLLYHNGLRLDGTVLGGSWVQAIWPCLLGWPLYVFGRAYDFISIEVAGFYLVSFGFLWRLVGFSELKRHAFPLFYLGFLIPPPGWMVDRATAPLQMLVSELGMKISTLAGLPVARQGVTLQVAQYQLLVEDACSGMNSLVGMTAVSLFYIYLLRRASWRYAALLVCLIVPLAVAVNVLRVVTLIFITYYLGDDVAQGFLHATTGVILFGLGLVLIFGADMVFWRILNRSAK
ncbi:exosortase [Novosphingobium subterraneum]|uniref:exosortase n=1 Tax=Novosphingobium subterraneum TaxID=48936 RepID=UPI003D05EFE8